MNVTVNRITIKLSAYDAVKWDVPQKKTFQMFTS